MEEKDQSVEKFLNLIKNSKKGRFKIYIGLAAGVGKTYKMLQEAHQLLKNGIDVKIGYIEPHDRAETIALTYGVPEIARKRVFYKGRSLEEMDVDAILFERPDVILVDELAHANIPGSGNEKRWMDVVDLLNAGINVISAVNIQHIESLNNVIEKVTSQIVKERVPDKVISMADEVVNIDLTVDELQQRLKEGKIYQKEKIQAALQNFFQKENLLQLRELALREVANQVERKIDTEITISEHKSNDRFLCCISSNDEMARKAIRKTARLANRFDAEWYVMYVQTTTESDDNIKLADQRHLINNFQLATELGANIHRVKSDNVVTEIVKFTKERNITLIVCGRANKFIRKLFRTDLISVLQNQLKDSGIDILVVN